MYFKKMNFIIWGYEEASQQRRIPNTLLTTYTHSCEPERVSVQAGQSHKC